MTWRGIWNCVSVFLLLVVPYVFGGLAPAGSPSSAPSTGLQVNTRDRDTVVTFYERFYLASQGVEPYWTGDVASCKAGAVSPAFKDAILRRINYFRAMAGVPADIVFSDELNAKCQQAALMIVANHQFSHSPPPTWTCYRPGGAEACGKANLYFSTGNSPSPSLIVDGYIEDPGQDNSSVGHRRWLLFPRQRTMGSGTAADGDSGNAIWIVGDFAPGPKVQSAWPPAGYVPRQLVFERWSFSFPQADFSSATVEMTQGGRPVALSIEFRSKGSGDSFDGDNTIAWVPKGPPESSAGDVTFKVAVRNVLVEGKSKDFLYEVTLIDVGR